MSEEQVPSVEEIKERLKVEIPVEEEATKAEPKSDVAEELKRLGKQFADTVESAWNSEERHRIEGEIREGVKSFVGEVDKAIREAKQSPAAERMRDTAAQTKERVESGDLGRKARSGLVQGMQWLSEELSKLADQFGPPEKAPEEAEEPEASE